MIAAWMLRALLLGVLVALAARAAEELCGLWGLPRRWVWSCGLLLALVLPTLLVMRPVSESDAVGRATAGAGMAAVPDAQPGAAVRVPGAAERLAAGVIAAIAPVRTVAAAAARSAETRLAGAAVSSALLGGWLLLSSAGVLLLGISALRLTRARRRWRLHRPGRTPVYVAQNGGPAVVGVFRPAIVLPAWLLSAPAERRRLVLLHEREHVSSGDHALLGGGLIAVLLMPWNVPLHWMLARLRLAVELDCDRRVLRHGADARAYGALLIDMATRSRPLPLSAAALADSASELEQRIVALAGRRPRHRGVRTAVAAAAAAALLTGAVGIELRRPAPATQAHVAAADGMTEQAVSESTDARAEERPGAARGADGSERPTPGTMPAGAATTMGPQAARRSAPAPAAAPVRPAPHTYAAPATLPVRGEVAAAGTTRRSAPRPVTQPVTRITAATAATTPRTPATVVLRPAETAGSAPSGAGSPAPLVLVDGVIMPATMSLNGLDPDRIDSIEVLKGPAAAALYGARAAGGVIRIATRR